MRNLLVFLLVALSGASTAIAADYDAALAAKTGADDNGMRQYVLVVLKNGPTPVPAGEKRKEMFKGHFANIQRLADAGKLAVAGPFGGDGKDGWRGLFIFAVKDVEEARQLTATDPVIVNGEMIAEYHPLYSSAALMMVNELHQKMQKPQAAAQ
jgi:uncharacterized protein YciI